MSVTQLLAVLFIIGGVFFVIVGVVGTIRLPDVYTRLHATGKVAILGLFGLLVGAAFLMPSAALKLIALSLFMIVTAPATAHAIAAAVHRHRDATPADDEASRAVGRMYESTYTETPGP